jgi:hypothetical protein
MCFMESRRCACGRHLAYLNFRDNILPPEILINLYCPDCSAEVTFDPECMVADCGWILEYDMEGAQHFMEKRGLRRQVTPDLIFDEGYLSWQGFAPKDHEVRAQLHQRLAPLIQEDLKQFMESLKNEWLAHVQQLKAEGWRRAQKT